MIFHFILLGISIYLLIPIVGKYSSNIDNYLFLTNKFENIFF